MKIRNAFLSVLALAAGSIAHGQLTFQNNVAPTWATNIRNNVADVNTLTAGNFTTAQLGTLNSLTGLFWNDITNGVGAAGDDITAGNTAGNPFAVGNNGVFDVKIELAYIAKESQDANSLYAIAVGNQLLYGSYGAGSTGVWTIGGPAASLDKVTFFHFDGFNGVNGSQANGDIFHVFYTESDPTYNYFIIAIDDRGATSGSDRDYDDGIFVGRFNAVQVEIQNPVPEPSTYGLMGAAALLGVVGFRRWKASKKIAA